MASNWTNGDDIQRKIEKEQIREQIIAEEIARRRILEEEVRRELMMEKEIAFRSLQPSPMSFGGYSFRYSPFLGHFDESGTGSRFLGSEHLPLQRNPDLVSDGVLRPSKETIVLATPETNLCGQKRKAPTPVADHEGSNLRSNKKLKEWNCELCNVVSRSEKDFHSHRQGRKHKAKVTKETSCGTTAVLKNCNSSNEKPFTVVVRTSDPEASTNIITYRRSETKASSNNGDTPEKAMPSAKSSEKSNFWCEMCKVGATCANDMAAHEAGKKHLAKLHRYTSAKGGAEEEVAQNKLESNVMITSELEAIKTTIHDTSFLVCDLSATSESGVDEHKAKTVDPSPEESIITLGINMAVKDEQQGRYVESTEKGDALGHQATQPSAKSCEMFKFWYETPSPEDLSDDKLYEDPCALPDLAWFVKEFADNVIDEDVLPKGAKETGKDAMQDGIASLNT